MCRSIESRAVSLITSVNLLNLPEFPDMFEELDQALLRFGRCQRGLSVTSALEDGLLNGYTAIIIFCTHLFAFFRNNPIINETCRAWNKFQKRGSSGHSENSTFSRLLDEEASVVRRSGETKKVDKAEPTRNQHISQPIAKSLPCYVIPFGLNVRFLGRSDETDALQGALHPQDDGEHLEVMVFYGIGGVGKTQLTLHYANPSMKLYHGVIWIPSETQATMAQALSKFAVKLGLLQAEGRNDNYHSRPSNETDAAAAKGLLRFLGGLSLATVQISEVMNDRGYSYEEILQVHQRSATKAFTGTGAPVQYGRTLDTAWECSFGKLSAESKTLLKILTFDLDLISESILNRRLGIADTAMEILFDDFDFGVGVIDLTRAASLVSRLSTHRAISIHRLVLFIVFSRLTTDKTSTFLNYAIRMLSSSFPNTWNERVRKLGHGRASCDKHSKILSHVGWLMALTRANLLIVTSPELLAELVFRAGR
uniref:DUF7779 domain-containing protein n=1 Tax=Coccidioides posadasii RMSCC 3488 TaxID=454284 RepID=A0A0J6FPB6_COCPO|nr:hypothetical protein CPAG_08511 [Coccidioides posadasii RMSCC 3488]